ncbi:MAG: heparan-alpha-glucosaminide N-acetyltransferase domain-containing protein [Saprospiraceae bacterium]
MEQVNIQKRIDSIDVLRGIAMIVMALDHVRDYFHISANVDDPLNLATTSPALFATRWITHFCAPIFIFLSGTSIYLQSLKKSKKELSLFLIKRGLWLVIVEFALVTLAWTFNPFYNVFIFQVIWTIGISMILLGVLIYIPYSFILGLGLILVCGHNILDHFEASANYSSNFVKDILHHGFFTPYEIWKNHYALIVYAFPVWTGVMMLGYCFGIFFTNKFTKEARQKVFIRMGIGLLIIFVAMRYFNLYGDPSGWTSQKNYLFTFLSFINLDKYPPSLLYLFITIGPSIILLGYLEDVKNWATKPLQIFGRTAIFYYVLHIYLIHILATIAYFARGHSFSEVGNTGNFPFLFVVPGEGYGLEIVYLIWVLLILLIYPLCKWYDGFKKSQVKKWWVSYV